VPLILAVFDHVHAQPTGYTKQVMVIYNGVHYDALAIAASPRADQDEDVTEYNPRTRRGKMILAAAQRLVRLCYSMLGLCH
jgi:ubiquitin thioesterase OTU1